MGVIAALKARLMIAWVNLLRIFLSYGRANNLAARTVHVLHPAVKSQQPAFLAGLNAVLGDSPNVLSAWQRHLALVGINRFQSTFYAGDDINWIKQCQLEVIGAEFVTNAYEAGRGVLVMTYHHHFNMLFCNLLGRLELPITTIAMDDRRSDRYKSFSRRVDRIYKHAERLLNGGDIVLVKPGAQVRPILRAFDKGHLVITANDFPDVFDDKNRQDFPFLGSSLSCPTGTVKLAVKKRIPIVAAYLDWLGDDRFQLVIRLVSDGRESMNVETAMTRYLAVLATMIDREPGLWEGWKWLGR